VFGVVYLYLPRNVTYLRFMCACNEAGSTVETLQNFSPAIQQDSLYIIWQVPGLWRIGGSWKLITEIGYQRIMLLKYHECLTCVIKCFRYSTNLYIITICNCMTQGNRNCSAVRARYFAFAWVCESCMEMLTVSTSISQPSSSQPQTYRGVYV